MKIYRLKRRRARDLSRERRIQREIAWAVGETTKEFKDIFMKFDDAIHEEIMNTPRFMRGLAWRYTLEPGEDVMLCEGKAIIVSKDKEPRVLKLDKDG